MPVLNYLVILVTDRLEQLHLSRYSKDMPYFTGADKHRGAQTYHIAEIRG